MKKLLYIFLGLLILSCNKNNENHPVIQTDYISGVDISSFPEISLSNPVFYDLDGNQKNVLAILKKNGINTVRLRMWANPNGGHCSLDEMKPFAQILQNMGFKIWLCVHYSDTWADPGQQETPAAWQGVSFNALKDSVYNYTERLISSINPEYIQIGNEINSGFLHPQGHIDNQSQFLELLNEGVRAVREHSNKAKIIMHFAGTDASNWFFNLIRNVDYDIIGLSYYPLWHGKSLTPLKNTLSGLSQTYGKNILIAETAYPFTLEWNDWTNNIIGTEDQLILPDYPATPQGQKNFIHKIKNIVSEIKNGIGFCYWGAELIAWKGEQATDGSSWENQALFDFENKALPILEEFKILP